LIIDAERAKACSQFNTTAMHECMYSSSSSQCSRWLRTWQVSAWQ
jgi:hypothetical protein